MSKGKTFLVDKAVNYKVNETVCPIYVSVKPNGVVGRVDVVWLEPISAQVFTFGWLIDNTKGKGGSEAFMERKMSSVDYHEGLQHMTQHYTADKGNIAYNA